MNWILKKIGGTKNERDLKHIRPLVGKVNALDEEYTSLSDEALRAKTAEFRQRLADGETTDDIMCEAFAVAKNASRRLCGTTYDVCGHETTWAMVPFDVQILGGIALHRGMIAEMATGEGKTLVATMPVYLNALTGRGVHLVTTNDYLARRDAQWMTLLYEYLNVSVGCIQNQMRPEERRAEYACDITYGTNSEFGFDYLRDNGMATQPDELVQRGYYYAIIDEMDNILIDEARTPLIISGPAAESSHQYKELKPKVSALVRKQRELCNDLTQKAKKHIANDETADAELCLYQVHQGTPKNKQLMHMLEEPAVRRLLERIDAAMLADARKEQARELREQLYFVIDERGHDASLTDKGCETLSPSDPEMFVLPDLVTAMSELDADDSISAEDQTAQRAEIQAQFTDRSERIHNVDQLIRAYCMYERDIAYVVQNNKVMIVDEFTGRVLPGRRWSDGLHQAVEAKEGVEIERATQTLATITIQNYFRMYEKLCGMTGTAETEAAEFHETYGMDVLVMPTNRPVRRVDNHDQIYKTQREKYGAIIDDIAACHERGQPVLVGTVSVDTSELIGRMLKRAKIPHSVLNAKQHEAEAEVVTRAGQPGAVTIATNMAGRGTDIKLGDGVVYLPRAVIESQISLNSKYEGQTLRDALLEKPAGLHVIGSERHEARRIDRQLRGRCARQGDPGSSRFYISLEDDLMRLFGSDRISGILDRLGLEEGQALEHKWLNRSIETAQKRIEQQNFSIRKRTLEYDDVMNKQREIVYGLRGEVVRSDHVREKLYDVVWDAIGAQADTLDGSQEGADLFSDWVRLSFPVPVQAKEFVTTVRKDPTEFQEAAVQSVFDRVKDAYELKVQMEDPDYINDMERHIVLRAIDTRWQDYLRGMDSLREGVGLRAYGQRDPLVEYKREAFDMFTTLMADIKDEVASQIFRSSTSIQAFDRFISALPHKLVHDDVAMLGSNRTQPARNPATAPGNQLPGLPAEDDVTITRGTPKVGRNDPCTCGSGKKFKKCCGM